jgi:hypothetical protein
MNARRLLFGALGSVLFATSAAGEVMDWQPIPVRIQTRWAAEVSPDNAWQEYPRPQLVRLRWKNLNGLWDYAVQGTDGEWMEGRVENAHFDPLLRADVRPPTAWDGHILIPFAIESSLSGVGRLIRPHQLLWYRRSFRVPEEWRGQRVRLNFEAVDWHTVVWVNGQRMGNHRGGYDPFSFDITDALRRGGEQEVLVAVWDPTNVGDQAIGKQALPELRRGYRYTPTSGIWQTVWLEPVPEVSIGRLKIVPDLDRSRVSVQAELQGAGAGVTLGVRVLDEGRVVAEGSGPVSQPVGLTLANPKLWSPDSPFLYDLQLELRRGARVLDSVTSYFGMRKIEVLEDADGTPRIALNGAPLFQFGPLGQGYWPDGIMTPPSDAAVRYDLQYLRDIGANMVRVHLKVHPARWYYWADRLGLLVWQDFVNMRRFDTRFTPESAAQWEVEQRRTMDHLFNHPSIVKWVVFNEAWAQFDTERVTEWVQAYDPTRLVTGASGWIDHGGGDIYDIHDYRFYMRYPRDPRVGGRPFVMGEAGGFDLLTPGHMWDDYGLTPSMDRVREAHREKYRSSEEWASRYPDWIHTLRLLQTQGLQAAVYTQLSDIEHEPNGWLTYDRVVSKIAPELLRAWHQRLYTPPPVLRPLLPLLSLGGPAAHYVMAAALEAWTDVEFPADGWTSTARPLAVEVTDDTARVVLLRRSFEFQAGPGELALQVIMPDRASAEVFLNGRLAKALTTIDHNRYASAKLVGLRPESAEWLRAGRNVVAVRYRLPKGAAGVLDVSLQAVEEPRVAGPGPVGVRQPSQRGPPVREAGWLPRHLLRYSELALLHEWFFLPHLVGDMLLNPQHIGSMQQSPLN